MNLTILTMSDRLGKISMAAPTATDEGGGDLAEVGGYFAFARGMRTTQVVVTPSPKPKGGIPTTPAKLLRPTLARSGGGFHMFPAQ